MISAFPRKGRKNWDELLKVLRRSGGQGSMDSIHDAGLDPLTLQPELLGGQGLILGSAQLFERHERESWTSCDIRCERDLRLFTLHNSNHTCFSYET